MPNREKFTQEIRNLARYELKDERDEVVIVTHDMDKNQMLCEYNQWTAVFDIKDGRLSRHPIYKDNSTGQIYDDEKKIGISQKEKDVILRKVIEVFNIRKIGQLNNSPVKKPVTFTEKRFIQDAVRIAKKEEKRTGVNSEEHNQES